VAVVETVRGPVDLGNLGQTLMHEHVYVLSTEHVQNYGSDWWDEEAMVARAIDKLNAVYAKGIRTIVDPTVWGIGRDIPRMQRIAAQTELNIIVATGLYVYEELPQQYAYRGPGLLIDIPEPMVTDSKLRERAKAAGKDARQLLGMREIFSEELANAPAFVKQVSDTLNSFYEEGARATLVKSIS
jgi:phosphotriesterase-related protein